MARLTFKSLGEALKHHMDYMNLRDLCKDAEVSMEELETRIAELEQILGIAKSQDGGCISQAMKNARSGMATAGNANLLQSVVSSLRDEVKGLESTARDLEYLRAASQERVAKLDLVDIVFDGPPGPVCGRFVEVEDQSGKSIRVGEWLQKGDYWVLQLTVQRRKVTDV